MKTLSLFATFVLLISATETAFSDNAIDELNMGLSKTSVFDTPTPHPFTYNESKPGWNEWLPRAWEGAPPQIPHRIDEYLPIVAADNQCLDCHDVPKYLDKPRNSDRTRKNHSPMSRDHYADGDHEKVAGARFTCTQCHVPQSDAAPLVESTYR